MKKLVGLIVVLLTIGFTHISFAATFLGPSPYSSFNDSPFYGMSFNYFHLEDFEDHLLNTPSVSVNEGEPGRLKAVVICKIILDKYIPLRHTNMYNLY